MSNNRAVVQANDGGKNIEQDVARDGATLWKKTRTKMTAIMAVQSSWGEKKTHRSIFGNQYGQKEDLWASMPDITIDKKISLQNDDVDNLPRVNIENVKGWDVDNKNVTTGEHSMENDRMTGMNNPLERKPYMKYRTDVKRTMSKVKKAARKINQFLNVVRLHHDNTIGHGNQLSYESVLAKLRKHYDPEGVHSERTSNQHEYYTDLGLLKRESLKHHPKIRRLLDQLWEAADKDGNGNLDKEEYMTMCRKVYKAVVDDSDDPESAAERQRIAEEDWAADAQGYDHLDYKRFTRAWFQLADHWTHDLSVQAYCRFLGEIKETVTRIQEGSIKWKTDEQIIKMNLDYSDLDKHKDTEKKEHSQEEVKKVVNKSSVPKVKSKALPKKTHAHRKPRESKSEKPISSPVNSGVILVSESENNRENRKARIHSRNGLFLGSTIPPPHGWNAKLTNEWGISFTRIRVESNQIEDRGLNKNFDVQGSGSTTTSSTLQQHKAWSIMARRARLAHSLQGKGKYIPHNSSASAIGAEFSVYSQSGVSKESDSYAFGMGSNIEYASMSQVFQPSLDNKSRNDTRPYTAPHPSGWQSAAHRYPVPFDSVSGAAGGGFEWYEPQLPPSPHSSYSFLPATVVQPGGLQSLHLDADQLTHHNMRRPYTAGQLTSEMEGPPSSESSLIRPSTSKKVGRASPVRNGPSLTSSLSLSNMQASILDCANDNETYRVERMGSLIMDRLVETEIKRRQKHSEDSISSESRSHRPNTAPNVRKQLIGPSSIDIDRPRKVKPRRRRQRMKKARSRSKSPPFRNINSKAAGGVIDNRTSRMRQRRHNYDEEIPNSTTSVNSLVRPKTTGDLRRANRKKRSGVNIAGGSLFKTILRDLKRPSSSSVFSSSKMMSSEMSYLRSRMLESSINDSSPEESSPNLTAEGSNEGQITVTDSGINDHPWSGHLEGGSMLDESGSFDPLSTSQSNLDVKRQQNSFLSHENMKGLPLNTRNLLNVYTGYDPMASLTEASLSICGVTKKRKKRNHNKKSRRRSMEKAKKKTKSTRTKLSVARTTFCGSDKNGLGMRVIPENKRTLRLMNLRETCSKDDILGVMLGMGAAITLNDITLSDVSSKSRQRIALVRFSRFADFKLALKMLQICNRATSVATLGKQSSFLQYRTKSKSNSKHLALELLWNSHDDAGDVDNKDDDYMFIPKKLDPLTKLRVPAELS